MSISARAIRRGGSRNTIKTNIIMNEERERDELDDVIDRCKMIERTGKSREELHAIVKKATMCMNIACCLTDVVDTFLMDVETLLVPFGATFERQDKLLYKRLMKAIQEAQKCAQSCCLDLYHHKDADSFAAECDWWYDMIRLITDRVGSDELKTLQVLNWLITMPSALNMFDVKKRDFRRKL